MQQDTGAGLQEWAIYHQFTDTGSAFIKPMEKKLKQGTTGCSKIFGLNIMI